MKKIFFLSVLCVALFTSCDSLVINSMEGNTIKFNDAFVGTTRATDITIKNLNDFIVHGWSTSNLDSNNIVRIFDAETVTRQDWGWSYQGTQYWFENRTFDFVAVAPAAAYGHCDFAKLNSFDGSFLFTNNTQLDLITARYSRSIDATIDAEDVEKVAFNFDHQLSRIEMVFDNQFTNGSVIEISNPKIKNLTLNAEFSLADSTWSNHQGTFPYDIEFAAQKGTTSIKEVKAGAPLVANHFYIIPENILNRASFEIAFTARLLQDNIEVGTYEHLVSFGDFNFEPGLQYRLKAVLDHTNINPEGALNPIEFAVSVTPWGEDNESEIF